MKLNPWIDTKRDPNRHLPTGMLTLRSLVMMEALAVLVMGAGCQGSPPVTAEDDSDSDSSSEDTGADTGTSDAGTGDDTGTSSGPDTSSGLETSSGPGTSSDTGTSGDAGAMCGNGILEGDEICDDAGESATCNTDCTMAQCGDLQINAAAGEECEGDELAGGTCEGLGFDVGTLGCNAGCAYDVSECYVIPGAPALILDLSQVKLFDFSWSEVPGAQHYQLMESPAPGEAYAQLGGDVVGQSLSLEVPLHLRWQASYVLRACNVAGCTDSAAVDVMGAVEQAVGYVKASNTDANDLFGIGMALSRDGNTLAVGAPSEDSSATGIDGDQGDDSATDAGAVYVFVRNGMGAWSQQAYIKASNTGVGDGFGVVALDEDGNTLVVGAPGEDSSATDIDGDELDDSATGAGAAYVFVRDGMGTWSQQAYLKASNAGAGDLFGGIVALSADGNTLAVGASSEDGIASGIDGDELDDSAFNAGAAYVFVSDGMGTWSQQAYVKASNTDAGDRFGVRLSLSEDGDTLAVGAHLEDSAATGIDGDQADDSAGAAGAAYVFVRDGMDTWSQQAYVKASNTDANDLFGIHLTLSGDGDTLAVSAFNEDSNATGVGGNQADNSITQAGAAYVFVRDGMGAWSQQAYVKASNTGQFDYFGDSTVLSGDGNTLFVSAAWESGSVTGIGGNPWDDNAFLAGAVYMFERDAMGTWSHQAYIKAPNTGTNDNFGINLALTTDGTTLAISAYAEASAATGIGGDQANDSAPDAGAVYLF